MESGPSPWGTAQNGRASQSSPQAGALPAQSWGLLKGPATVPAKLNGTLRAGRREVGAGRHPEPGLRNVVKEGSPGEGSGGEDLGRGGAWEGARGQGPRLLKLRRFPPDSQPRAERPLQLGSP